MAHENLVQSRRHDHLLVGRGHDAVEAVGKSQDVYFWLAGRIRVGSGPRRRNYDLRLLYRAPNHVDRERSLSSEFSIRILRRIQLARNRSLDPREWDRALGS